MSPLDSSAIKCVLNVDYILTGEVLIPGDEVRSRWLTRNFVDAKCFSTVILNYGRTKNQQRLPLPDQILWRD